MSQVNLTRKMEGRDLMTPMTLSHVNLALLYTQMETIEPH